MSARRAAPAEVRTRRWPVLVLIPLLIVAAVAVQRHEDDQPVPVSPVPVSSLMPVAPDAAAPAATWYCAGGTATGTKTGVAEQSVEIANVSDQALTARLTAVPDVGTPVEKDLPVPAHSRQSVLVSSLVVAPNASVIVETDGGEIAVSHVLTGPTGSSTAACSSSPSASWFFPSGNSEKATASHQLLALFNPFPSDAVVSVTFDTDDGARAPVDFSAIVVPGNKVTVLDVSGAVTLRKEIATTVTVRSGRIIADQIQYADGTQDTTKALAVTPGAPQPSPVWWFADGPAGQGDQTSISVMNPSDHDVDVELQVRLDDATNNGQVDPFTFTVPAGRYFVENVTADGRVPLGIGYTAVAVATDGTPIVADRVTTETTPSVALTVSLGSPATGTRWVVPVASGPTVTTAVVTVTNPSSTDAVTVTVSSVADGTETPIPDADQVEIPAGERGAIAVPIPAGKPLTAVEVVTSAPGVVEALLTFKAAGLAAPLAVPVQGTAQVADSGLPPSADTSVTLDPNATIDPNATLDPSLDPTLGTGDTTSTEPAPTTTSSSTSTTVATA